ncbi:putative amino acid transporter [Brochothrix thermosphacta DSM 20171 = FSL F6-1036]|nr:putative amino acid transporter [Brochothrix thermosphacta DSM 20171 = FSL F6-1036]
MSEPEQKLERNLSNRHVQLIAIGGAIGTGLFLGAGKTIHLAGPSLLLVYLIVGIVVFFMMRALGELLLSNTEFGSFADIANEYIGPWAGFFCWLDILVMLDCDRYGRNNSCRNLCWFLVS